jgi:N-methylhydantoinase A
VPSTHSEPARSIIGVDVGGTFTDFFLIERDRVTVFKRPSTPDDPARGVLQGLREFVAYSGPGSSSPASGGSGFSLTIDEVVHGSTVATNAIIERKGARTALITTRGFKDVLLIGRQTRPKLYDLQPTRTPPLIPDDLRLEAAERLDHTGAVLQPLDPAEVERLLDQIQTAGVESLAVCFLFSFLSPDHERLVADAARRRGIPVSPSHEILPEHREYERTSTTVANAYVAPVMTRYLSRLQDGLRERGVRHLRVMASNGGSVSPVAAGRLAVRTAVSGPAGGVAGAFALAFRAGFDRIISLDMGGTSTDVSLCPGRILERDETLVGDFPVRGPTVDVLSVGAGGGSIARIDEGGALRVGPESAGADPGPACYGRGDQPTVTDAHVALGRIAPEHFLGGRMAIDPDLALEALRSIAEPFARKGARPGTGDALHAAAAVLSVANANMERALRVVSVERGHDPHLFTLVPFGGASALHACDLARSLRIPRVLVPLYPGVLSALGMATAPIVKDVSAAAMLTITPDQLDDTDDHPNLSSIFDGLRRRGEAELRDEGSSLDGLTLQRFLDLRYVGQSFEISIPVDRLSPGHVLARFHDAHNERYGHSDPARPVEVVTARLKLILPSPGQSVILSAPDGLVREAKTLAAPGRDPIIARRRVWFDGEPADTPIYDRSLIAPGLTFDGPAVVVQMDATTTVPPGWRATADAQANLLLEPA